MLRHLHLYQPATDQVPSHATVGIHKETRASVNNSALRIVLITIAMILNMTAVGQSKFIQAKCALEVKFSKFIDFLNSKIWSANWTTKLTTQQSTYHLNHWICSLCSLSRQSLFMPKPFLVSLLFLSFLVSRLCSAYCLCILMYHTIVTVLFASLFSLLDQSLLT